MDFRITNSWVSEALGEKYFKAIEGYIRWK